VRRVIQDEAAALEALAESLGPAADRAVEMLHAAGGRVIVTGMGKMGAIARKAAATLCSTGTPAIFLHPVEALHGDLGIVSNQDVLVALSASGETDEVLSLLGHVRRWNVGVIAITCAPASALAQRADVVLDLGVRHEADTIADAPTSSTTAALAVCDGLAVALMNARGFTRDEFAIFHPAGHLGRKLLLTVGDVMHCGERVPIVASGAILRQAIVVMSQGLLGAAFVVDDDQRLVGIITDGDLRRIFQRLANPLDQIVNSLMTAAPHTVAPEALAAEALALMEQKAITVLPVVDPKHRPIGAVHLHTLLQAGLA